MEKLIFSGVLGLIYGILIWWGALRLPGERWQIAASIPLQKDHAGFWRGVNLTFYGLFTANAVLLSACLVLIMLGSLGLSPLETMIICAPVLLLGAVSARLVARWVEKKSSTFTVAGASFMGLLTTPWVVLLCRGLLGGGHPGIQVTPIMAAIVTCWTLGEGMGRLACLSFGCCYGRSLDQCPRWMQRLFERRHLVFSGPTKKISYESGHGRTRRGPGAGAHFAGVRGRGPGFALSFPRFPFQRVALAGADGVRLLAGGLRNLSRRFSRRPPVHRLPVDSPGRHPVRRPGEPVFSRRRSAISFIDSRARGPLEPHRYPGPAGRVAWLLPVTPAPARSPLLPSGFTWWMNASSSFPSINGLFIQSLCQSAGFLVRRTGVRLRATP